MKQLSQLQREILSCVLANTKARELWEKEHEEERKNHPYQGALYCVGIWGVSWKNGSNSLSTTAAISRALRRLEDRELVLRQNKTSGSVGWPKARTTKDQPAPARCTSVLLTATGRTIAESLEAETVNIEDNPDVNRLAMPAETQ